MPQEDRWRQAIEASGVGVWSWDLQRDELTWDERCREIFALPSGASISYPRFLEAVHPKDRSRVDAVVRHTLESLSPYDIEYRTVWPDGSTHWIRARGRVETDAGNKPELFHGTVVDITARREAEQVLLRQAELIENAHDAIVSAGADRVITGWNRGATEMYGYTQAEAVGRKSDELLGVHYPEGKAAVEEALDRNGKWDGELVQKRRDGSEIVVESRQLLLRDADGLPEAILEINRDITGRKRTQDAVLQSQKLESVALLAGGVAHDFNNLLTGILAGTSMALDSIRDEPTRQLLIAVISAAESAAHLTRQLLAFAGKGSFVSRSLDLGSFVRLMRALLEASVPKRVRIEFDLAPNTPNIAADEGQIQQLVVNLVTNAAEAIPGHGVVRISTGPDRVTAERVCAVGRLQPRLYARLEVADSGAGMDPEVLNRIFDPFYTTKFIGRGLGLAAVAGIVRARDGALEVKSSPGRGSAFRVWFPAIES